MQKLLVALHVGIGELAILAFIWVAFEIIFTRAWKRAAIAAWIGFTFFILDWIVGGYYYVVYYGAVKALIKAGPEPWAHLIVMEAKEHIYLFLPFLAFLAAWILKKEQISLPTEKRNRWALLVLVLLIIAIGGSMAGMGYLISWAARAALLLKVGL